MHRSWQIFGIGAGISQTAHLSAIKRTQIHPLGDQLTDRQIDDFNDFILTNNYKQGIVGRVNIWWLSFDHQDE